MDISKRDKNLSITVGKNLSALRKQVGLTIDGLTFALSISVSYTLMIERGDANISQALAERIAAFFDIKVAQLYLDKLIVLKSPYGIPAIHRFYQENEQNEKFFIHRRSEYSTANFLRAVLIVDKFLLKERSVGEIRTYCLEMYKRELNSQELSRELRRFYLKGVLKRKDKYGNGSAYLYCLNDQSK